ncbi:MULTISPECIES: DUF4198 domain-containing protein [Brucella/Ochrobactrum group]|jgi:hypothetical protein|uniref:DUF4198 domain-containing protein n=1 Tax=Brucella pseudintermedia TaxID=370111 RepID=A0ABY5UCS2_9HYPH|nr:MULTISPECIES: DUF4198 domain-containing protein [Brucella/Ochrobactrum group]KAB2685306.1 DUF4198 domain-containing protein [Brucella pseudintermedia]NKE76832.1 DUF4198 domain-containing protein [Ochrobactrum sp. MC-1LL]TWG98820.1 hypothetical protein L614_000400001750 [Ochrobactrum sp. J50]UWL61114.1 DUF4198 domain-containing protein [Brucella pseudintermedia]WPM79311.1 DUF4198 domain-containing protein [Brucella pseudintermedia]
MHNNKIFDLSNTLNSESDFDFLGVCQISDGTVSGGTLASSGWTIKIDKLVDGVKVNTGVGDIAKVTVFWHGKPVPDAVLGCTIDNAPMNSFAPSLAERENIIAFDHYTALGKTDSTGSFVITIGRWEIGGEVKFTAYCATASASKNFNFID